MRGKRKAAAGRHTVAFTENGLQGFETLRLRNTGRKSKADTKWVFEVISLGARGPRPR
jgi:hypothetical protein